jgi:cytoskeletal protein RodZ
VRPRPELKLQGELDMYSHKLSYYLSLASVLAVTASITVVFAESEASLQAGSSSSTMNNAQAGRETSTSSSTQNNSQSSNQQTSQATTENTSHGSSEAVGGTLGDKRPTQMQNPAGVNNNSHPTQNASSSTVTSTRNVGASTQHIPHAVTRSYAHRSSKTKHSFSTAYMNQTIHQAARRQ